MDPSHNWHHCCQSRLRLIDALDAVGITIADAAKVDTAMPMKYVMLKLEGGELLPLIFPEFYQHSHMAQALPANVVSAGRVAVQEGRIVASGASTSLGISSRAEDSEIIQNYFDGQNVIQHER
jgi:hypothetical protein